MQLSISSYHLCLFKFTAVASLAALTMLSKAAHAQYTFTSVVNNSTTVPSGGTFSGFQFASISGSNVAFQGLYNGNTAQGIFANTGAGGALSTIADSSSAQAPGGGIFNTFEFGAPRIDRKSVV